MRFAIWSYAAAVAALTAACGGSSKASDDPAAARDTGAEVELHDEPSREELAEVLGEQAAHIRECGAGGGETVKVEIVFEGASGRPVEINYPDDASRSVRVCIESNLVHAFVQPFQKERFTVTYPFKLRDAGRAPEGDGEDLEGDPGSGPPAG